MFKSAKSLWSRKIKSAKYFYFSILPNNCYSDMYTSRVEVTEGVEEGRSFECLIDSVDIPKLSDEDQELLEKDLTLEELKEAVSSFSDNKTPGEDGFTKNFTKPSFDLIWTDLIKSYNAAFQKGPLSVSQRRGTITLIPKQDEKFSELSNWRPISLLNVDYKILTKVLSRRLQTILPQLVNSDQTGFVKERYIGQNIRLLRDITEYLDARKMSGLLLFVDFEKAFDSLEWDFFSKCSKSLILDQI